MAVASALPSPIYLNFIRMVVERDDVMLNNKRLIGCILGAILVSSDVTCHDRSEYSVLVFLLLAYTLETGTRRARPKQMSVARATTTHSPSSPSSCISLPTF